LNKRIDLNNKKRNCVFCNYPEMSSYNNGKNNKLLFKFSKYDYWYCALSKYPLELGHTLIIYKGARSHCVINFENLNKKEWIQLKEVIRNCKEKMRNKLRENETEPRIIYFFMLSETKPHHLHFHLIPNFIKDERKLKYCYDKFYHRLLYMIKKEYFRDTGKTFCAINKIVTNFGHWYLGILEMKKNVRTKKENYEKLHKAAEQLKIYDKTNYWDFKKA